jgi:hypothetical protein
MLGPPQRNEPNNKARRSRPRWIWYVVGSVLALVVLVVLASVAVRKQAPSPLPTSASPGEETGASTQPTPKESEPEESRKTAAPPGVTTGGGGPAEAPPVGGGGGGGGGIVGGVTGGVTGAMPPPPLPTPAPKPQPESAWSAKFPQFPWPPPRASATVVLPDEFLRRPADSVLRWGDVDRTLTSALDACGYFDRSYYAVPDGFAIVTRLEQMQADGTSKAPPDRWAVEYKPVASFSLALYLRALFTADPGFYRIIVFVVTSQSFSQRPSEVSREEAMTWLQRGLDRLPADLAGREYTGQYACTALIYQFEQPGSGEGAKLDVPSDLPGRTQLERAKLWQALGKPAIGY